MEVMMKKSAWILILGLSLVSCTSLLAGPPRGGGHGGGRYDGRDWRRNDGVRLATDIVNLVGASINILRPQPTIVVPAQQFGNPGYYVQPAPPVIVQQPYVAPTPVVISPPVYIAPPRHFAPPPPQPYRPAEPRHGGYRPSAPPRH